MRRVGPIAPLLLAVLGGLAAPSSAGAEPFALEGTWHVLVHYRDAEAPDPGAWLWEDRVWDLQRQGDALLWTDYELVNFVDVRGRFADLRSAWARRVRGAWEPDAGQLREIERGLFVNPRGARTLRLEPAEDGLRSRRRELAAPELGVALRRRGAIRTGESGLPVFTVSETVHAPDGDDMLREAVFRARTREEDGGLSGDYMQGSRSGRFRMRPTRLRDAARPEIRHGEGELVLQPDRIAQWTNLVPALLRPWRYFGERVVHVESTPPGALLEVSYLRDGARRLYEETRAPVALHLPSRLVASSSDVVQLDAFAPGFRPARRHVALHGDREAVRLELEPSANRLVRAWLRTLGGATSIMLFTEGPLDLQVGRSPGRLTLVLADTTAEEAATALLTSMAGPFTGARALQLRESLVLRLALEEPGVPSPRFLRGEDAATEMHRTEVRLPAAPTRPRWADRVADAAARADPRAPCADAFDRALRAELDETALARALTLPDPRLAPLRDAALGALAAADAEGRVQLLDGTRLDPARPVALAIARSRAAEVRGLLAAFRTLLADLAPDPAEALRGVVAPALAPDAFAPRHAAAVRAETACLDARAVAGGSRPARR